MDRHCTLAPDALMQVPANVSVNTSGSAKDGIATQHQILESFQPAIQPWK
jgi:hypothetical protein